ncbi:MAG: hypothetical protein JOZ25_02925 [Actinobacteria bacterium]|nr:hypothetical protein [Actinomycetota bacterium]
MRRATIAAAGAAISAAVLALASPAGAQVDKTCELTFARLEPNTSNTLLLDTNAVYWLVSYQAVPGTRLRVTGEFPHSRYISYNLYDAAARPIDALSDIQIKPDHGSANPFLPGARRTVAHRRYTLFLEFTNRPKHPAPNTLYAGTDSAGHPNLTGSFWYRVYVPDRGRNIEGGVPLPTVSVEPDGSRPGATFPTSQQCATYQAPTPTQVNQTYAQAGLAVLPQLSIQYPGRNPPAWRLYVNLSMSFTEIMLDNAVFQGYQGPASQLPTNNPNNPGIFANRDNAYVYTAISRGFGNVLVVHARGPTFANTHGGAARMPRHRQVRYFSMCEYEPLTQRVVACSRDDRTVTRNGSYTYVISQPGDRPKNATSRCGATWIPWGPQPYGLLIYRQLLAESAFARSIKHVGKPGREVSVMRRYYPTGTYYASKADFERTGCPRAGASRKHRRGGSGDRPERDPD